MAVLEIKDGDRMETVRTYERGDPVFSPIDNRPIWDLEERTKDLNDMMRPARWLRVRGEDPASADVEVEEGWYIDSGITPTYFAGLSGTAALTIPACAAGTIRIDLIYFNLESGACGRQAGTPVAAAGGFGSCTAPDLPAGNDGCIPLAHLYVDETPTPFDRSIAINVAGHIRDVRPCFGARPLFEDTAGNLATDVASGNVGSSVKIVRADHRHPTRFNDGDATGVVDADAAITAGVSDYYARTDHDHIVDAETNTANLVQDTSGASVGVSTKLVRADHAHPLNVDAVLPVNLAPSTAAAVGVQNTYARRDHIHALNMETLVAYCQKDLSGGSLGSRNALARSDHRHDVNVDGTAPAILAPGLSQSAGVSTTYSRVDHRHTMRGIGHDLEWYFWNSSSAAHSFVLTGSELQLAIFIFCGRLDTSHTFSVLSVGAAISTGTEYSASVMDEYADGNDRGAATYASIGNVPGWNIPMYHNNLLYICTYFDTTTFSGTTIAVDPKAGSHGSATANAYGTGIMIMLGDKSS